MIYCEYYKTVCLNQAKDLETKLDFHKTTSRRFEVSQIFKIYLFQFWRIILPLFLINLK